MNKINIDKVKQITSMVLSEQGKTLYISPVIYAIALMFVFAFMDSNHINVVEDVIKFSIPLSMIIPTLLVIHKFVSDSHVQRIITLPASNLDKYTAMLVAIVIQSVIWFVIILVTDVVLLLISCSVFFGTEASVIMSLIFNTSNLRLLIPMMYIASFAGWWKIASRTAYSRRILDYVLIVISFIGYPALLPLFINQSVTAVVIALSIYSLIIMILAIVRSYYNFKKIVSYVNK